MLDFSIRTSKPRTPVIGIFVLLLLKLLLLRYFFFEEIMWSRIAVDAASLLVLLSLIELVTPSKAKRIVYWIFNLLCSVIFFASALYFQHFNTVPTYTALSELKQVGQIKTSVQSTIETANYLFFVDIVVIALVWITGKLMKRKFSITTPLRKRWPATICVIALAVSVFFIHQDRTIANEVLQAEHLGFFNYQVAAGLKAKEDAAVAAFGNIGDTVDKINLQEKNFKYQDQPQKSSKFFGAAKGKNVIVIQMEAFQNFPIHLSVDNQELTPVLNSLAKGSFYFPRVFQQIGQGNTSDAEFMSNTSIYPTATVAMSTGYGDRELPSMPRLLEKKNYEADTFHVNDVKFWDRNKLYPALNFTHYYDKPNYKNDHFNEFGASDEELYKFGVQTLSKLHQENKPFYAQFITVSSHHPFNVPEDRMKITIPASLEGTQLGNYLAAVNYTDYAIGTLIEQLKQNGMWDDTVLVIYGDHFGLQPQDNDPEMVSQALGIKYDPRVTRFNIPLIIHVPGTKALEVKQVGGQVDIMPTLANLLGISLKDENFTAFGHDLLNIDHNVVGSRYYLPTGSFFNDEIMYVPGKTFEEGSAVNLDTLEPVTDFSKYREDYDYNLAQMKLSDEYVKLLPKR
ncbi:LTA synthase family protein [Paenibacillus sp.]|jgi:phosphoglycerol transferase MdoB-like AlkP superfamily enzyme|uniref:LTA synthase family protein n=1 Tax=Paenibacillus sp. TaxID=58172 RepID=UPI00282A8A0D|nr:LTA synthase family protein [Paenibacillus sp.]MDR0268422.1 LTA synthase family protein [Paenibacillus sp.]